jgi:hypothetical protein
MPEPPDPRLQRLTDHLVQDGMARVGVPTRFVAFTGDHALDALLNDIEHHPHAFLLACLADRQVRAEKAWSLPGLLQQRLGGHFDIALLSQLSETDWLDLMRSPTPLHRLPETMARTMHRAVLRVRTEWASDASGIWRGEPSSATLVRRLLAFHGAGPKIATMAANILVRDFHVQLSDCRYIDISADVHIRRVMYRLGFVQNEANSDDCIYAARDANPEFPGVFDLALWEIGRKICRPGNPNCDHCPLYVHCNFRASRCRATEGLTGSQQGDL